MTDTNETNTNGANGDNYKVGSRVGSAAQVLKNIKEFFVLLDELIFPYLSECCRKGSGFRSK